MKNKAILKAVAGLLSAVMLMLPSMSVNADSVVDATPSGTTDVISFTIHEDGNPDKYPFFSWYDPSYGLRGSDSSFNLYDQSYWTAVLVNNGTEDILYSIGEYDGTVNWLYEYTLIPSDKKVQEELAKALAEAIKKLSVEGPSTNDIAYMEFQQLVAASKAAYQEDLSKYIASGAPLKVAGQYGGAAASANLSGVTAEDAVATIIAPKDDPAAQAFDDYLSSLGAEKTAGIIKAQVYSKGAAIDNFGTMVLSIIVGKQYNGREAVIYQMLNDGTVVTSTDIVEYGAVQADMTNAAYVAVSVK